MYKYVLNSVVKISLMFAQHFEYYAIILTGPLFVDTLYVYMGANWRHLTNTTERFVRGVDAALCQITLTTCYYHHHENSGNYIKDCVMTINNQSAITRARGDWS